MKQACLKIVGLMEAGNGEGAKDLNVSATSVKQAAKTKGRFDSPKLAKASAMTNNSFEGHSEGCKEGIPA